MRASKSVPNLSLKSLQWIIDKFYFNLCNIRFIKEDRGDLGCTTNEQFNGSKFIRMYWHLGEVACSYMYGTSTHLFSFAQCLCSLLSFCLKHCFVPSNDRQIQVMTQAVISWYGHGENHGGRHMTPYSRSLLLGTLWDIWNCTSIKLYLYQACT